MKTIKIVSTLVASIAFTLTALAQTIPSYVPTNGLVGYWGFNGNANDESGNGNNGTVNGATLTTDRNGNVNSSYSFNGNSGITIPHSTSLNIGSSSTFSFWLKYNNLSNGFNLVFKKGITGGCPDSGYYFAFDGIPGPAHKCFGYGVTGNCSAISDTAYLDNQWHNIIVVYNLQNSQIYFDGILQDGDANNNLNQTISNTIEPLIIGYYNGPYSGTSWNGLIDDFGIWNRVLTQSEITQLYTAIPAPTASAQIFCSGATVESLVATGTDLNWYTTSTGGTPLASTTPLTIGTYYVSQTLDGSESLRTAVPVTQTPAMSAIIVTNVLINIDTQSWAAKNLDVATYSDGTPIPQVTDPTAWAELTTGAWCYYNNDAANGATYGKLYNWYAVAGIWNEASKTDATQRKKLAPTGYHVPTDAEWTTLTTYLGGESIAGGKMKATGTSLWNTPNTDATNSSGFSGLPGGCRDYNGTFFVIGYNAYWWSSSEFNNSNVWYNFLDYYNGNAYRYNDSSKTYGFSVRCLRD